MEEKGGASMLDSENCVGRLRRCLEILRKNSAVASGQAVNVPDALAAVVDAPQDSPEFHLRYCQLLDLATQAKTQVQDLPDGPKRDRYLQAITEVHLAFTKAADFRKGWDTAAFAAANVALLEICEFEVQERLPREEPTEDCLETLLSDVQNARQAVAAGNLEPEVEQLLTEMLRDIEQAIKLYRLTGIAGLRRAVERSLGVFVFHKGQLSAYKGSAVVKTAFSAAVKVATILRGLESARLLLGEGSELVRHLLQ